MNLFGGTCRKVLLLAAFVAAFVNTGTAAEQQNLVTSGPRALIEPTQVEVARGERVTLTSQSVADANVPIVRYQWAGPGGQRSNGTQFNLETSQLQPGRYVVDLTVTDLVTRRDRASATVIVRARGDAGGDKRAPVARIEPSTRQVYQGERIRFANDSYHPERNGQIVRASWRTQWGQTADGDFLDVDTSQLKPGKYRIDLVISDNRRVGATARATLTVLASATPAQPPLARITPKEQNAQVGEVVEFDGRRSSDAGGRIRSWSWTLDGQPLKAGNTGVARIETAELALGSHTLRLEVTDEQGFKSSDTAQLIVAARRRNIDLSVSDLSFTPERPSAKRDVQIRAVVTNQGEEPAQNIKVRITVGNTALPDLTIAVLAPREAREVATNWLAAGSGEQALTAMIDPDNQLRETNRSNNRRTRTLIVSESTTVRISPDPAQVHQGEPAKFTAQLTLPPGQNAASLKYLWRGPGGAMSQSAAFQVDTQNLALGKHGITLEVTDESNLKSIANATLVVTDRPIQLTLRTEPTNAQVRQSVKFIGEAKSSGAGTEYKFIFGDGRESAWSAAAETSYDYDKPGTYKIKLLARRGERVLGEAAAQVQVADITYEISFTKSPDGVQVGDNVTFTAALKPAADNVEYQFRFGDGLQTEWLSSPSSTHVYSKAGTYAPSVSARLRGRTIDAKAQTMIVAEKKTTPWLWGGLAALLAAIAGGGYLMKRKAAS